MSITAAAVALVVLGLAGLDVPFLRQVTGLVFLTFVPGRLVLRLLRFRTTSLDTLLYAAGLSLALVMFLGLFMNVAYPALGIARPIATLPVTVTLAVVVTGLCGLAYRRERRGPPPPAPPPFAWREAVSPPVLLLVLLPLLSVLGAYLVNARANNILLLALLGLIALVAVLVAVNRFIPPRLYPLAILMVGISLLWHWSLVSGYVWGYDIHHEYYYQSQVLAGGVWDPDIFSNVNSMLSIVILAPVYSLVLGMDSVWIFKAVYPLIFALLPLALFQIFRRQADDRLGFLAVFVFVSFSAFFADLVQLGRQQVAELFFALFVLALLDTLMTDGKKRFLLVVFGLAIVVSHYGLAYFFLFYLVLSALMLWLMRNRALASRWDGLWARFGAAPAGVGRVDAAGAGSTASLTMTMVFLMIVFCFAWYLYIGRGSMFNSIINIGVTSFNSLKDLFALETRETSVLMAVGLSRPEIVSVQRNTYLVLQYVIQAFIVVGVAGVVLRMIRSRFQPMFIAMVLVSSLLLAMSVVLPRFSLNLHIGRIYHIALMFLAPFCVIGGTAVCRGIYRLVIRRFSSPLASPVFVSLVGVLLLAPYFLFSTGFVYAVTGDRVTSMPLNPGLDSPRYNRMEVAGKAWLLADMADNHRVMADIYGTTWLIEPAFGRVADFWGETAAAPDFTYIYLRTINARQGLVVASEAGPPGYVSLPESVFGREVLARSSRIYDSGGAQVFDAAPAASP
jgi:uncharacterized membrane protein